MNKITYATQLTNLQNTSNSQTQQMQHLAPLDAGVPKTQEPSYWEYKTGAYRGAFVGSLGGMYYNLQGPWNGELRIKLTKRVRLILDMLWQKYI
jgi:hypothetical protein